MTDKSFVCCYGLCVCVQVDRWAFNWLAALTRARGQLADLIKRKQPPKTLLCVLQQRKRIPCLPALLEKIGAKCMCLCVCVFKCSIPQVLQQPWDGYKIQGIVAVPPQPWRENFLV